MRYDVEINAKLPDGSLVYTVLGVEASSPEEAVSKAKDALGPEDWFDEDGDLADVDLDEDGEMVLMFLPDVVVKHTQVFHVTLS
jgi:hypothetical protein